MWREGSECLHTQIDTDTILLLITRFFWFKVLAGPKAQKAVGDGVVAQGT